MAQGYLELKISWELFQKAPDALSAEERERLLDVARKQSAIELRILGSGEAAQVIVPAATLNNRVHEIRQRYPSSDEFSQDMARNGLDEHSLASAVERDLRVEAVLEKVAAATEPVSQVDAEIYYRLHPESFDRPEARKLRHILITYDNGNEKAKATSRLEGLRSTLNTPEKFAEAALRHSQCPTAMEGGTLGVVKRQQLYAALEPAAFALRAGEVSPVQESPIGLHILRCDEILDSGMLPFEAVRGRIIELLTDKRRRQAQRDWIKTLVAPAK